MLVNAKNVERLLWVASGALIVAASVESRSTALEAAPLAQRPAFRFPADTVVTDSALADSEDLTTSNDPFRLSNRPPIVRFDPDEEATGESNRPVQPPPLRPTFSLKAIVGGPPWQAVIDGIPGQPPSTIVREK